MSAQLSAATSAFLTERTFEIYVDNLQLDDGILETANVIVDLGAGMRQEFARGAKDYNPGVTVVSIDPRFALSEDDDLELLFPEERFVRIFGRRDAAPGTIAALAQSLPIATESVDLVVAQHSVPQYIETADEMSTVLDELLRVVRPGGQIRLYPVLDGDIYKMGRWVSDNADRCHIRRVTIQVVGGHSKSLIILTKR